VRGGFQGGRSEVHLSNSEGKVYLCFGIFSFSINLAEGVGGLAIKLLFSGKRVKEVGKGRTELKGGRGGA